MRIRTGAIGLALALFLLVAVDSEAAAQSGMSTNAEQQGCGVCWTAGLYDEHKTWGPGSCTGGASCFDCQVFNSCHSNWQAGDCSSFHWYCGVSLAAIESAEALARSTILRAATVESKSLPGLYINNERQTVQVLNCRGEVIAQYRFRGADEWPLHRSNREWMPVRL